MSLKPMPIPSGPSDTARVARAAFPKGNIYMKLHERLGTIIARPSGVADGARAHETEDQGAVC
jgi:hypothetical protein